MRTLKKTLCVVLCLVMMVGLCAFGVSAEYADEDQINNTEAVNVLSALKVLQGDERGFRPADGLTRAEGCTIIAKMIGMGSYSGKSEFADCQGHWGDGAIAICASKGFVNGYGDGNFGPDAPLTGYAFAKMLLCALGYDQKAEKMTGVDWEVGVATLIKRIALDAGLEAFDGTKALKREDAAQLGLNTLTQDMIEYVGGTDINTSDGTSIKVGAVRGVVATPAYTYLCDGAGTQFGTPGTQFCEEYFPTLKYYDALDDFGVQTAYWYQGENRLDYNDGVGKGVSAESIGTTMATYDTGIAAVTLGTLFKDGKTTVALPIKENGVATGGTWTPAKGSTANVGAAYKGAQIKLIDNDNDGKADFADIEYAYLAKVTKVTEATASASRTITMTVYSTKAGVANVTYTTNDFAKGDYVLVYPDNTIAVSNGWAAAAYTGHILDVVAAESFTGKVTNVTGTNGTAVTALTVGGTSYPVAVNALASQGIIAGTKFVSDTTYAFTTEYTFFTNNGHVIGILGEANAAASSANIVWFVDNYTVQDEYGTNVIKGEVVNLDGTTETLVLTAAPGPAGFYTKAYNPATKNYALTAVTNTTATPLDNATKFFGQNQINGAFTMAATTKNVVIDAVNTDGNTKAYVNDATKILFVTGAKATLKVTTSTGPIAQNVADDSYVLLSKDAQGNYVVEALIIGVAQVDVTGTVVFTANTATGSNAKGSEYSIYSIADGAKSTVTASAAPGTNFATFTKNSQDVYTFTAVPAAGSNNGNGTFTTAAALTGIYGNLISAECGTYDLVDCDASEAVIFAASAGIPALTLADLKAATALTAQFYVKSAKVVAIAVTAYTAP